MVKVQQEDNPEDTTESKQVDSQDNNKETSSKKDVIYKGNSTKFIRDLEPMFFSVHLFMLCTDTF